MAFLGRFIGITFALIIAVMIGGYFYLQDANRLKPELESLLADNSDYEVKIQGDVKWVLFPPLNLDVNNVALRNKDSDQTINIESLNAALDVSAMWEDINQWQVKKLTLSNTTVSEDGSKTTLSQFALDEFRLGQPAPMFLDAVYQGSEDEVPLAVVVDGLVTYYPETEARGQRVVLQDGQFESDQAAGICQIDATEVLAPPTNFPSAQDDDLLPLALLNQYDVTGRCALTKLVSGTETFNDTNIELANVNGDLSTLLEIRDFMGGTFVADIDVDTRKTPVEWTIMPEVSGVDSQRLLDWRDRRFQWLAALGFSSSIQLQGNTVDALANSVRAKSEFDGGQGQINITKIKEQLAKIAAFTRKAEEVNAWPDLWDYQEFTGLWNINGPVHDLKVALDNMSVDANGSYDYLTDSIDMMANVIINEAPENSPFRINPLLQGTPIPVRCVGAANDPVCRVDQDAAQQIVARALQRGDDSGLRSKIEQKIDEKVPEEYRETARGLLDLLGRALEDRE